MLNPANVVDVEALWRPLTADEEIQAATLLGYGWLILQGRSPGLVDRLTRGVTSMDVARFVMCQAVLRVMRNPDGHSQGSRSIDDFAESWTLDATVATGALYFTDHELLELSAFPQRRGSFSIVPGF